MKEIEELNIPGDIYYSKEHEWAAKDGDLIRIGISDYLPLAISLNNIGT